MITATATEIKNNVGRYQAAVQSGDEMIVINNGKDASVTVSSQSSVSFLTDSLTGVLKKNYDDKKLRAESIEVRESTN